MGKHEEANPTVTAIPQEGNHISGHLSPDLVPNNERFGSSL